ncbi:MAG: pyridoxamine kinase [Pseudoflavonifractor sp.]
MNSAPKVVAVHDMTGFGRCSLTVVLPVLAAMGAQCCPIPTAYLSAHTAYPHSDCGTFLDLTAGLAGVGDHWAELGVAPDAIYSGFLGSAEQIGLLLDLIARFRRPETLVLVDPVMGDWGAPYRTYTREMCEKMSALAAGADVITPNLTEAALLLGEAYCPDPKDAQIRDWLTRLALDGKRSVVITGVSSAMGKVGSACLDRKSGKIYFTMAKQEEGQFPGTGDLFSSVLLGCLLRGEDLQSANISAVTFVQKCVARTLALGTPILEGVQFEGALGLLMG